MKEITRISLASLPYNIEVDARKLLDQYLRDIERALNADVDAMKEIESRIAELLADRGVVGEKVIARIDVEAIKTQLGAPTDFIDESTLGNRRQETSSMGEKKLYRDPGARLIGGVCAGLAAYFRIDVVWIRLAMIILAVLTSGVMILLYLAAWVIMPAARTAAERLQMKGRPVTLEALQEESAIGTKQGEQSKIILKILRITMGIGFIMTACGVMLMIAVTLFHLLTDGRLEDLSYDERMIAGFFAVAAAAFVVFCFVVARALFANRYSNRFWIVLGALSVLGVGSFAVGGFCARNIDSVRQVELERSMVAKSVDASKLLGIKELVIKSDGARISYIVTADAPKIMMRYSRRTVLEAPATTLDRTNDTVTMTTRVNHDHLRVRPYIEPIEITVYGPALSKLDNQLGVVSYETLGQDELTIHTGKQTSTRLVGTKAIRRVTANTENASLDLSGANIVALMLTADSGSDVQVGNIASLEATVPESCPTSEQFELRANHANTITLNGVKLIDYEKHTPCMSVMVREGGN